VRIPGKNVTEQLRQAVRDSGKTLTQLAKDSGVGIDRLSRFVRAERSLTLPSVDGLCHALGLYLAGPESADEPPPDKPKRKGKK
jgi:hypothetical protein